MAKARWLKLYNLILKEGCSRLFQLPTHLQLLQNECLGNGRLSPTCLPGADNMHTHTVYVRLRMTRAVLDSSTRGATTISGMDLFRQIGMNRVNLTLPSAIVRITHGATYIFNFTDEDAISACYCYQDQSCPDPLNHPLGDCNSLTGTRTIE